MDDDGVPWFEVSGRPGIAIYAVGARYSRGPHRDDRPAVYRYRPAASPHAAAADYFGGNRPGWAVLDPLKSGWLTVVAGPVGGPETVFAAPVAWFDGTYCDVDKLPEYRLTPVRPRVHKPKQKGKRRG